MKTPEPGAWQTETDEWGGTRRFRMIGNVKEYEPTVSIGGLEIPQSDLEEYRRREKAQKAAQREKELKAAKEKDPRRCPFKGGNTLTCGNAKCALYTDDGCVLAKIVGRAAANTAGRACPFSTCLCSSDCALYKNGCVLTAIQERT